jgi:hypothetical protein
LKETISGKPGVENGASASEDNGIRKRTTVHQRVSDKGDQDAQNVSKAEPCSASTSLASLFFSSSLKARSELFRSSSLNLTEPSTAHHTSQDVITHHISEEQIRQDESIAHLVAMGLADSRRAKSVLNVANGDLQAAVTILLAAQ